MNPLRALHEAGQAAWLDFLRRGLITGGMLERLVDEDGLAGVTSNPSIFGKAIGGSTDYDDAILAIGREAGRTELEIFYDLALTDIQMAADVFRSVYEETNGRDGFVSFELEPRLAHDTEGTIRSARDLFERIGKPNVMIKVPGTPAAVPAVEELVAAGVNVNITLLFSVDAYESVARAYLAGLERRLELGEPVDHVASVASFFVSRVDTVVDRLLPEGSPLRGKVAIANGRVAYQRFRDLFSGERWGRLASAGAQAQRPLWASTGTKDPAYSDVVYVEELVGPHTVNTMPQATLDAFRHHGRVRPLAIVEGIEESEATLGLLAEHGVNLRAVTDGLLVDGIQTFQKDLEKLLAVIGSKVQEIGSGLARRRASLGPLESRLARRLVKLEEKDVMGRIWRRDHTVWKQDPTEVADRLGWLTVPDVMRDRLDDLGRFAAEASADGFRSALLLGMGGSSLAPEVLQRTLGVAPGSLEVQVLDTTHPAAIAAVERSLDLERTLFVVASKSGGTIETLSHLAFFYDKLRSGKQFVAITDPGTPLEALARARGFRAVFLNPADIGGRYSALSLFGLVPGALMGANLHGLLDAAEEMAVACHSCVSCEENPGAWLGAALSEAARAGRDKLTLFPAPGLVNLSPWVEQLVAESTGKEGKGILPVVGEDVGDPAVYGSDRLFIVLGDGLSLEALEKAGHPVVRLTDARAEHLGAEFFRWEVATAVAGQILSINPFDQPNVAEAKVATKRVLDSGTVEDPGLDDLEPLLSSAKRGDYVAILAYLDPSPENEAALQRARLAIRDRFKVATTSGFGPRYLHSTGQFHKGGPNSGLFIQVVDVAREVDVPIPGQRYTFGSLIDAQALGDLRSLRTQGRRVVRVTLERLMEVC